MNIGELLDGAKPLSVDETRQWWVRVRFGYNPAMVQWIKALPGSEYSFRKSDKSWRLPIECLSLFFQEAKKHGVECDVSLPGCRSFESDAGTGTAAHFEL
jgi:hypothetical protein